MTAARVSRQTVKSVLAIEMPEGVGATVRRSIGTSALRNFTPFLMLDHVRVPQVFRFVQPKLIQVSLCATV